MKSRLVIIGLISVVIYLLLIGMFYLATPFMISWGAEVPWYIYVLTFMQDFPFSLIADNNQINMNFIFINALFWTLDFCMLFWILLNKTLKK